MNRYFQLLMFYLEPIVIRGIMPQGEKQSFFKTYECVIAVGRLYLFSDWFCDRKESGHKGEANRQLKSHV